MLDRKNIAVCGDVMLDTYWHANVSRISPEAPVPVADVYKEEYRLGGAANVANNLTKFGARVDLYGAIGQDADGSKVSELITESGVNDCTSVISNFKTIKKLRIMSQNQQLARCDFEDSLNFNIMGQATLIKNLSQYGCVILSDYNKGFLTTSEKFLEICAEAQITTVVDPKKTSISSYAHSKVLKPNLKEFHSLFSCSLDEVEQILKILRSHHIMSLIVTLGAGGVRYFNVDGSVEDYHVPTAEVFDVTGAGDTFTAAYTYMIANSFDNSKAIEFANMCARSVVGKLGTSTLNLEEISKYKNGINAK